jgi:hypothetical protein
MPHQGYTLSAFVDHSQCLQQIRKGEIHVGDRLLVVTCNSIYSIHAVEDGLYLVSGGWFDRKGVSPMVVTIRGCTWGGSAIKQDVVVACGLCLEFGNRVITSRIRKVFVLPCGSEN